MKTVAHLSVHLAEAHRLDLMLKLRSRCRPDRQSLRCGLQPNRGRNTLPIKSNLFVDFHCTAAAAAAAAATVSCCLTVLFLWSFARLSLNIQMQWNTRKPSWRKGYARQHRHSTMAVSLHLEFYRSRNIAIRSANPENPNLEPNMEWIRCSVCEIFAFKLYCDHETGVRRHSRSLKAALFDRAHMTLYSSSIVTMPLSITVSEL